MQQFCVHSAVHGEVIHGLLSAGQGPGERSVSQSPVWLRRENPGRVGPA